MRKQLLLVRHAQAHQPHPLQKDFERELNATGYAEASRMGRHLREKSLALDAVFSSAANRAKATAQLLTEPLGFSYERIVFDPDIYEATVRKLMQLINGFDEAYASVMVFGHNPHISYLAEFLTHQEIGTLPTCGVVSIGFDDCTWKEITGSMGKLEWIESPEKIIHS